MLNSFLKLVLLERYPHYSKHKQKESHQSMKLFLRRTDNGFHNSRQVAKGPTNLVHGNTGSRLRIQGSWLMVERNDYHTGLV